MDLPYSGTTSGPLGEQVWMCPGHDAFRALDGEGVIGLAVASITTRRWHQELCASSSTSFLGYCFPHLWPESFQESPRGSRRLGMDQ